jgi:hypothetical protein
LWEQNIWFLEQKNLMLWEQIYSFGNKPCLSEQKYRLWEQKPMVVGTKIWLREQRPIVGTKI